MKVWKNKKRKKSKSKKIKEDKKNAAVKKAIIKITMY